MPLAKDKYGGLLIVEEVEDVKAILKLIPLVTCIAASIPFCLWIDISSIINNDSRIIQYRDIVLNLVVISWALNYYFINYPFLYNHIPNILKRIGIGISLMHSHIFSKQYLDSLLLSLFKRILPIQH